MRDYGLPPQVWGGEQHEHEWVDATWRNSRLNDDTAGPKQRTNGGAFMGGDRRERPGAVCPCGAWLGSLGLEPTPELYVEHLVSVFREVRRVLRPDGVCWVNLGDSYAGSGKGPGNGLSGTTHGANLHSQGLNSGNVPTGCKPKDLLGMPWAVAFALRADGWYLRAEIIWSKPSPMPESVTDRPTKAHETVFLLAKSRSYFYDADAIREKAVVPFDAEYVSPRKDWRDIGGRRAREVSGRLESGTVQNTAPQAPEAGRNKRSVWEIASTPFPGSHFAVFPPKLVEPMLLAGTSEKGCCPECGAPCERVTERAGLPRNVFPSSTNRRLSDAVNDARTANSGMSNGTVSVATTGWRPTCPHDAAPVPCQVLDPFAGAGTTGLVADRLGRDCTLVELNPEYAQMARDRITGDSPLFAEVVA